MEKISVIVPVYNSEKKLDKCLLSIVNQTYKNIEIIVINDGSKDNSLKIINKYKKLYPDKIKVYSWENHGIGMSRNKGICLATGDYIGFVDSDDYIELNMYEELINLVKINKADVGICNLRKYNDLDSIKDFSYSYSKNIFSLPKDHEMINIIEFGPCNKLFKKELFNNLKFSIKYKFEDLIPVFIAILNAKKVVISNKALYNYYINDSGETQTINKRNLDMYYVLKELLDYLKPYKDNYDFWSSLEKFCVYRIYEVFGNLINTKYNYLLDEYITNSINLLKENFGNFSNSLEGNFLKRKLLTSISFCKIFIKYKRRKFSE